MVECKICGRDCGIAITRKHLSFYHNMSLDEYKSLYGKDICWNTGLTKETNSKVADMYGEEFGKKISAANLVTWKDPKVRARRIKGIKDDYKTKDNTERNEKIRIGSLKSFEDPVKRANKLKHIYARKGDPEWSKIAIESNRKAMLNGHKPENNAYTTYHYDEELGHIVRSKWEANFSKALNYLKIDYQYEPKRFDLGDCFYTPDFYLTTANIYVEISGWKSEKKIKKLKQIRELYPEVFLVEMNGNGYKMLEKNYSSLIDKWEGSRFSNVG